jgi:hypothetical protein
VTTEVVMKVVVVATPLFVMVEVTGQVVVYTVVVMVVSVGAAATEATGTTVGEHVSVMTDVVINVVVVATPLFVMVEVTGQVVV